MPMRVIVTGGAGYIGSHICKALKAGGFEPVVFDNLSTGNPWAVRFGAFEHGDLADANRLHEAFARHRPAAVIHCAASALVGESMTAPWLYYRNNVVGMVNLLEAVRLHGVGSFVFSSSCATYGAPAKTPIAEDCPQNPINPYGATKLMGERMLSDYAMASGLKTAMLRYFNAAGADPDGEIGERRDIETHIVPLMLDAVLERRPPLRIMGDDYPTPDGTGLRDYVHIADLAQVHVLALRRLLEGGESFTTNVGTGSPYSVRQLVEAAERITGREVPRETAPRRAGDPPQLMADQTRFNSLFGAATLSRSTLDAIIGDAWRWHQKLAQGGPG